MLKLRRCAAALGLAAVAALGVPAAAWASTTPVPPRPATTAPASIGGPATAVRAARVAAAATGVDLCAQVAAAAGFANDGRLVTAVAIGMAESGCNPQAQGVNGPTSGCPGGSVDRGLWQINSCYHNEVTDACAYDAQCNANAAYSISAGGTSFSPWSTYNSGLYRNYLSTAQAAVNRLCTGCGTGTIVASPLVNVRSGAGTGYGIVGHANNGDTVRISCYRYGEYVSQGYWPSNIWDYISDPSTGVTGFAADTWIQTSADVRNLVPAC